MATKHHYKKLEVNFTVLQLGGEWYDFYTNFWAYARRKIWEKVDKSPYGLGEIVLRKKQAGFIYREIINGFNRYCETNNCPDIETAKKHLPITIGSATFNDYKKQHKRTLKLWEEERDIEQTSEYKLALENID